MPCPSRHAGCCESREETLAKSLIRISTGGASRIDVVAVALEQDRVIVLGEDFDVRKQGANVVPSPKAPQGNIEDVSDDALRFVGKGGSVRFGIVGVAGMPMRAAHHREEMSVRA